MQKWAVTNIDIGLKNIENIKKGITIFANVTEAKIAAANSTFALRKSIGKKLYLAKTEAEVTVITEGFKKEKDAIKEVMIKAVDLVINEGKDLKTKKPTEKMNPKNAISYLTSFEFMTSAKADIGKEFETNTAKVFKSMGRRAILQKKVISRRIKKELIEKKKIAIAAIKVKMIAIRVKKTAALEKLKALRLKNAWVKKANEDDDLASKEAKIFVEKKEKLVKVAEKLVEKKKKYQDSKYKLKGIRDRLVSIRKTRAANRVRRTYWRRRQVKSRRRLMYIRKRRSIYVTRLKRFRLRKSRAIAAAKKAKENEENTTDEEIKKV